MSSLMYLEDGRALNRSNLGYCGMLVLIAREIPEQHKRLRTWLEDLSDRTAPFCEFDIRGLSDEHRQTFWTAAARAGVIIRAKYGGDAMPSNAWAAENLLHLLRMHSSIVAGEPPSALNDLDMTTPYSGMPEDLQLLWRDATA